MRIEQIENKEQLFDKLKSLRVDESEKAIEKDDEFNPKSVMNSAYLFIILGRISMILGIIATALAAYITIIDISVISTAGVVFAVGLLLLVLGTFVLAGGRIISCLVAIEKNTRR
jgi:hypothetical protein